jgi:EAL domain-containing protein (putative c-di-GMP-specific phosphodiesterase class I)
LASGDEGLSGDLSRGLQGQEVEIYYQPLIRLSDGRPSGAEALLRWRDPERGPLDPAHADGPLGRSLLESALSMVATWDFEGLGPRVDMLLVAFSAAQLGASWTTSMVAELLVSHGIAPGRLCIQVTGSVMSDDSPSTRQVFEEFKQLGVEIALDDFGSGFSSPRLSDALPATIVKVDASFIEQLDQRDRESLNVVGGIVGMCHSQGFRVVAKGVTSPHIKAQVSTLGFDLAQGEYVGRPMSEHALVRWWRAATARSEDHPKESSVHGDPVGGRPTEGPVRYAEKRD